MAQIIKEICVDVAKRNLFQAIIAKQHDNNSRFLKVTLTNEGKPIQVDSSSVVTINARRADNEARPFGGVVNSDGTVTVPLAPWMLELDDVVKCDIGVVDTESRKLTSTSFELEVETAAYDGDGIEEDENYDLLVTLLSDVANAIDECREVTASAPKSVKVTVTQGEDGSYSADKTYTQVSEAYEAGDTVYCEYGGIVLSLTQALSSHCVFTCVYNGSLYNITIKAAGGVTVTTAALGSGGGIHVGTEPPTDESIDIWINPDENGEALNTLIPDALPNPQKLTLTGAVNAEYDGSQAVTVALPEVMTVELTESNGTYTANKTQQEILAAYEAGQEVRCIEGSMVLPLVQCHVGFCAFACVYNTKLYSVLIKATDNSVTMTVTDASASGDADLSGYIPSPETAAVGQTVVVKAVDENGKPTQWEAVDLAGGSSADRPIELIRTVTIPADIATDTSGVIWSQSTGDTTKPYAWEVNTDESGETLNLKYFAIVYRCPNAAATSNSPFITIGFGTSQDGSQSSGLGVSTADRRSGVFIWDGKLFIDSNLTSEWSSPTLLAPRIDSQNFATVGINSVDRIRLWFNNSSPYWPEGATFKIYGVRA